ncbi:MAG: COG4705 family protein [Nocardioidaceae bacterium]
MPEVTLLFWVVKVLTTGMGEAASDFLGGVNLVLAGVVGLGGFVLALWLQLRVRRYVAATYWFAVAMVAVFGTMAADVLHVVLGISYVVTTTFWGLAVAVVFFLWHRSEGTLSIHSITTRRRETFYWTTVLATFALGTAAGDLTATQLGLGFLASGVLFAAVMLVPALGWWRFGMNNVLGFWFAYVVTRPLGASFADWLGKPPSFDGGLGYGDGTVTAAATVLIVALVGYLAVTRIDIQPAGTDDGDDTASPEDTGPSHRADARV